MSEQLGRPLAKGENVHHKDGDRLNNALDNLELWTKKQPPGQRVIDKVDFAIEMLTLYPEFARARGYELRPIHEPIAGLLSTL
jgi:HNH endonuclease